MKTAEQILIDTAKKYHNTLGKGNYKLLDVELEAMKAYAMQECERIRQQCADNATVEEEWGNPYNPNMGTYMVVDKQSILSIPIELT